jgi:malate synthase
MPTDAAPAAGLRGFEINTPPAGLRPEQDLPAGFLEFFLPLHRQFTPLQQELVRRRGEVLQASLTGKKPNHLPPSPATQTDWKITLPEWCQDQRNQMTGPADDGELVVKMLNSGAPGVMIDLEDSEANFWENLERGIANSLSALRGELNYFDKKRDKQMTIQPSKTVIWTRVRGLHLNQKGVVPGKPEELASGSLYDVCRMVFAITPEDVKKFKHPLSFYIPKSESAEEAFWWNDLFKALAGLKGWPEDYIKCMALVEAHPLAYQMEEYLYNLRDHILGLNLGRWDYMASLIHFNLNDPEWVLPDRNTIPHDVKFFQNLRDLLPEICHKRGAMAIGGMTALYPSREDPELNARALAVLEKDKKNEANSGMDGAWTGHPDQNEIAVNQFPNPNQLSYRRPDTPRYPDLRPVPHGVGAKTVSGTRAAIRTVIRYRNGVLNGRGASLLDGYMEDLATDRIYRNMIKQRMMFSDKVSITDESGKSVLHTPELISRLFDEELANILKNPRKPSEPGTEETFTRARKIAEAMILNGEIDPI